MNAGTVKNVSASEVSNLFWVFLVIVVCVILYYMYDIGQTKNVLSTPGNIAAIKKQRLAIFDTKFTKEFKDKKSLAQAIQEQNVEDKENCLINFQPLTVIYPGYLGPMKDGVFDEKEGVTTAIRMGARCFVLPIDFHSKDTMAAPFPEANKPCLLFRDKGGVVRSINAGDISTIAQTISDVAWSNMTTQKDDPFILILYFLRTPPENTKEYLDYMSKVAIALGPLSPYLLGQTPDGVYNRQARQNQLMYVNTRSLEKKLIILCNADTSGFRTAAVDFKRSYIPKEDLDYWVHMRIFKQNVDTSLGVTTIPTTNVASKSQIDYTKYYTELPTDETTKKTAINGTKEHFTITLSPSGTNPISSAANTLLDTYGVQSIPLFLIDYSAENESLLAKWKYAWRAKPKPIRYVRPDSITTQQQSQAVNANGGSLTIPS